MYVRAKVTPGAKKESITLIAPDTYAITVREPAARNLANRRARELLAHVLQVSVANVRIVSGHRSPTKVMSIDQS